MHKGKIQHAINSALMYLHDSMQALAKNNDEKAAANSLWFASSETEYVLFLFSLIHLEKSQSPSWKQSSQMKKVVEVDLALTSAQSLLKEARRNMEAGVTEKAYEETWKARDMLLKVQELFEKKQKSVTTLPTRTR